MNPTNNIAWFEKYRPQHYSDYIVSNPSDVKSIKSIVEDGTLTGNIISYGPGGTGKTSLNNLIINNYVNSKNDIFKLGRKIDDIDKLVPWLNIPPYNSKRKIVVCEEFNLLSDKAMTRLKDGLMENHINEVSFIVTTNEYNAIDSNLKRRFNHKFKMVNDLPKDSIYNKLLSILNNENISYDINDVNRFIDETYHLNLSDKISSLQMACITGSLDLFNIGVVETTKLFENYVIDIFKWMIALLNNKNKAELNQIIISPASETEFNTQYLALYQVLKTETTIDYDYVYKHLLEYDINMFETIVITNSYQQLNNKIFKYIHLYSLVSELVVSIHARTYDDK